VPRRNVLKVILAGFGGTYFYLLVTLLLFFVLQPFLPTDAEDQVLLDVFLSAVLVAGVYTVMHSRMKLIIALSLVVPAIIARWALIFFDDPVLVVVSKGSGMAFFAFNTITVLWHIMTEREITRDTIYGAICGYLLLGMSWGVMFALMEFVAPGSFTINVADSGDSDALSSLMFYYSFVSLTTLGYGDIIPVSAAARSFSTLEAVTGQLYLTILVARLVGLHITRRLHD